ncbi:MAG: lipoyl(octanoyl) transferase LipB [Chloroflexi bacterium]|jgi:lipoyl(octanoyl) transferase|nr:lipoyl(octanoyl) transferase LipB [Chloroflexota bacterium]MBT4142665.1 lipoyl(octanoyl) transferase LipB [Chloroflexota bacterium]MBT5476481.1 lipoyl(octanoyl) transferase LipB [Chloroflexota bacterium]MBT6706974.1 lipoyl(octanoyl) transferase LipB [Chloroflexota bacterium]MBT7832520.1 lipoyl(octanoyl) transferase LipB [Chloroflexota bacterium]
MNSDSGITGIELRAAWLGEIDYGSALDLQRLLVDKRKSRLIPDSILFLEHSHVVTLGRRADDTHLVTERSKLLAAGVEVFETDRGGEATYHGLGQLVGYPIIDVRMAKLGPVTYVRMLEKSIIETLVEYGIDAHLVDGETGVWVDGVPNEKRDTERNPQGRKIAAIGVRISSGVTMHGFALNVSTDLSYFQHIIPCGMPDLPFTSIEIESDESTDTRECAEIVAKKLSSNLDRELLWTERAELLN